MGVFIRAIVTGFGFSLGKALFDKVSERVGLTTAKAPEVPDPDAENKAADFRDRVLRGLGREREGRLAPAVKRYAEELLR